MDRLNGKINEQSKVRLTLKLNSALQRKKIQLKMRVREKDGRVLK